MQHVDPEVLALLALGEDVADESERTHIAACSQCADEVAELGDVADTGRAITADDGLVAPAPHVWERIRAELGMSDESAAPADPTAPADLSSPAAAPVAAPVDLAGRRSRRSVGTGWLAVAASVALVVGVAAGALWQRGEDTPGPGAGTSTIASTQLEALPDWTDSTGTARVEQAADGRRQVVVSMDAPPTQGGYREVWLIAPDLSGLVSIGVLEGQEGRFDIPEGLDLTAFSLVDVSEEHFDGDPSHSGDSIVRGALDA